MHTRMLLLISFSTNHKHVLDLCDEFTHRFEGCFTSIAAIVCLGQRYLASSHCVNQFWLIVRGALGNNLQWNLMTECKLYSVEKLHLKISYGKFTHQGVNCRFDDFEFIMLVKVTLDWKCAHDESRIIVAAIYYNLSPVIVAVTLFW